MIIFVVSELQSSNKKNSDKQEETHKYTSTYELTTYTIARVNLRIIKFSDFSASVGGNSTFQSPTVVAGRWHFIGF